MAVLNSVTIGMNLMKGVLTFECDCIQEHRRKFDKLCNDCGNNILKSLMAALGEEERAN